MLIVLAVAVSVLESVGAVLIVVVLGFVTNADQSIDLPGIGDLGERFPGVSEQSLFVMLAVFIGAFFIMRAAVNLFWTYAQMRVANNAGVELSSRLVEGYLYMPYSFHLQRNSSELIRNAHESVLVVVPHLFLPLVALVSEGSLVIAMTTVLLIRAPAATIVAAVVLAPVVFVLLRSRTASARRGSRAIAI